MPQTTEQFRVIIVGGGIAGLCAAIAFRGENRRITVLEQSRLNREIGATISLQPNASKIVEQTWGMAQTLEKISMADKGFRIFGTDGTLQKSIPLQTSRYGADRMIYHRQDLHDALKVNAVDVSRGHVEIKVSSRVVRCDSEAGIVHLEDGTQLEADLIIAADGIKSRLRDHVVGRKIAAKPTGFSAYRLMADTATLEKEESEFCRIADPRTSMTTMIMAHDRRLIMGPARDGFVYSVVALVPDQRTEEDETNSWTSSASLEDALRDFEAFPSWTKAPFRHSADIGLWQLRDIDSLETWHKGRVILIGDAAHAMLPTQGQGASQAVEDAEALSAFFSDIKGRPTAIEIEERLAGIVHARHERASTIQRYSRESARPATAKGDPKVSM
jgi:salicylate hydroxylase